ncbi:hypothetical protein Aperf_G00000001624 [Anoplocephala perfoliata]
MSSTSGKNLSDLLYQYVPLNENNARFYIAEVMCALEKMHEVNIIHMNIEPNNILIHQSGHIVLANFDHSLDISSTRTWPNLKHFRGNLKFMAPEVANKLAITTKADVWSLGILAATMVSGCARPHKDRHELEKMAKERKYKIARFRRLSVPLRRFLKKCLARDNTKRPEIRDLKSSPFFQSLNWRNVYYCNLQPPFKPDDIVRFADYGINPRDANILSAALDERFPDLTYSPENQGENISILEGVQHDPDDIQRAGFTTSRLEELFAHSDFMDFNFFEYIREESRRLRIG